MAAEATDMTKHADDSGDKALGLDPPGAPLYGNENYVSDRRPRVATTHTQEEWLAEATDAKVTLERGDHVSPDLIEMLFLDAYDVIVGFTPPAAADTRKKKE